MLDQISARQLAEWMAYERVAGPLDDSWLAELVGQIHELFQHQNFMMGMKVYKNSKVPKPRHVPRPREMWGELAEPESTEESEEEKEAELKRQMEAFDREAFGSSN